ncbi:LEA type 2 family protein [Tahibacter caeni]|uniref:NDR1/HIN1-like protein n=1 Tax=Tahibacter caeni TaxID=1453545 RepID=UPI002147F4F8|nr:LEA type 2 family protein [Tahibacter caeni]
MKLSHPIRAAFVLVCLCLLAACGGGKPVRRINPPALSIQQLAVQADGRWLIELRVQNFSTVPMRFDTLEAGLEIEGTNVGAVFLRPAIEIPGQSADIVEATLSPGRDAGTRLAEAARDGSVGYQLRGTIETGEPAKKFPLSQSSRLSPVPGRPNTYR